MREKIGDHFAIWQGGGAQTAVLRVMDRFIECKEWPHSWAKPKLKASSKQRKKQKTTPPGGCFPFPPVWKGQIGPCTVETIQILDR